MVHRLSVCCSQGKLGPNISNVDGTAIVSVRIQPSVDTILIPDTVRASDRLQLMGVAIRGSAQVARSR